LVYFGKIGLGHCLTQKWIAPAEALALFVKGNELDISNQNITDLPKEIGDLAFLNSLNIAENHIKEVHPHIAQLKNLESIFDYKTVYSTEAEEQMHRFFPKIYAEKYNNKAASAYQKGQHEEATEAIEVAIRLYPQENNYLITKAAIIMAKENDYEKTLTYLQKAAHGDFGFC
jgi:tetratricopeptide (TPR) repeat protein